MNTLPDVIQISDKVMGGTPVFRGTRVPVQSLFDHLEGDISLEEFLDDFPSVSEEQAITLLNAAFSSVLTNTSAGDLINIDSELMSGTPVFRGTRVPTQHLLDHLSGNETITDLLTGYPSVTKEQAVAFLKLTAETVLAKQVLQVA